jgi:hypothetical protein
MTLCYELKQYDLSLAKAVLIVLPPGYHLVENPLLWGYLKLSKAISKTTVLAPRIRLSPLFVTSHQLILNS